MVEKNLIRFCFNHLELKFFAQKNKKSKWLIILLYVVFVQLVEVNQEPRIKLSEDMEKVTMPGMKDVYRLYGQDGQSMIREI